jgi:hypothetical protein
MDRSTFRMAAVRLTVGVAALLSRYMDLPAVHERSGDGLGDARRPG